MILNEDLYIVKMHLNKPTNVNLVLRLDDSYDKLVDVGQS